MALGDDCPEWLCITTQWLKVEPAHEWRPDEAYLQVQPKRPKRAEDRLRWWQNYTQYSS